MGRLNLGLKKSDFIASTALALLALALNAIVRAAVDASQLDASLLMSYGAHYAPRTSDGEAWRLLTSVAIEGTWLIALINALSLTLLGAIIVKRDGEVRFILTLMASSVAACVAASLGDPQAIVAGSTAALFGLSVFALVPFFNEPPRNQDWSVVFIAGAVTLLSVPFALTQPWLSPIGCVAAGFTGYVCHKLLRFVEGRDRVMLGSSIIAVIATFILGFAQIQTGFDEVAFIDSLRELRAQTVKRLKRLESDRISGRSRLIEFTAQLDFEVLRPVTSALEEIESVISRDGDTIWLNQERTRIQILKLSLEMTRDVNASQENLRLAQEIFRTNPEEANSRLDRFWTAQRKQMMAYELALLTSSDPNLRFIDRAIGFSPLDLKLGIKKDLDRLTSVAIDLEILQTETWLSSLKSAVIAAGSRSPASNETLTERVDAYLSRLSQVAKSLDRQESRVTNLQTHLVEIRSALGRQTP